MRRPTTSPTSSSASRPARAGSRSCTARSSHELVRRAGNISVHVIAGDELAGEPIPKKTVAHGEARPTRSMPRPMLIALVAVAVALGVGLLIQPVARRRERRPRVPDGDRRRRRALRPVAVAAAQRRRPRSATISSSCRRSTPSPSPTRTTSPPSSSSSRGRHRLQRRRARAHAGAWRRRQRARTTESLYPFSRKLAGAGTLDDVLWATAYQIALDAEGARRAAAAGRTARSPSRPAIRRRTRSTRPISRPRNGPGRTTAPAGRGSDTLPGAKRLFLPMRTGRGAVGVVGIDSDKPGPLLTPDAAAAARCADRPGGARHRARAPGRGHGPRQARGRDRPVALGAADLDLARPEDAARRDPRRGRHAARLAGDAHATAEARDLLATIIDEVRAAQPLHRQPARHDQARIRRHRAECLAARCRRDRRQRACGAPRKILADHQVEVELAPDLPMLRARSRAVRAGAVQPARQCREICARRDRRSASRAGARASVVCLQVLDEGDGIPPADLERIFDKFYRVQKGDQVRAGTGLGLASARGFVEAMGGTIAAATAPTARARCSPSRCRSRPTPRQLDTAA